jgi:hypothetical protein
MLRSSVALSEKVSELNWREFTAGRLVGTVKNEDMVAFTAQKPSVAVRAMVNLSFFTCHAANATHVSTIKDIDFRSGASPSMRAPGICFSPILASPPLLNHLDNLGDPASHRVGCVGGCGSIPCCGYWRGPGWRPSCSSACSSEKLVRPSWVTTTSPSMMASPGISMAPAITENRLVQSIASENRLSPLIGRKD